jgi:hypothetical protein
MRRATQENRAASSAERLSNAMAGFQIEHGVSPRSLSDLAPYLNGDSRYGDGEDNGYLFVLDGERLTAAPAAPGKTGIRHFCVKLGSVYDCTRPEAVRLAQISQQRMRLNLLRSAAQAAAELLRSDDSMSAGSLVRTYLQTESIKRYAFDLIDSDDDGKVTFRELLEVAEPDTVLGRFFEHVRIHLELGAGDEDIDTLPGVGLTAIAGDATVFFKAPTSPEADR